MPLAALADAQHFAAATTEVFGPFQVIVEYSGESRTDDLSCVEPCDELCADAAGWQQGLDALKRMSHHLTAAVVSSSLPSLPPPTPHTTTHNTPQTLSCSRCSTRWSA